MSDEDMEHVAMPAVPVRCSCGPCQEGTWAQGRSARWTSGASMTVTSVSRETDSGTLVRMYLVVWASCWASLRKRKRVSGDEGDRRTSRAPARQGGGRQRPAPPRRSRRDEGPLKWIGSSKQFLGLFQANRFQKRGTSFIGFNLWSCS